MTERDPSPRHAMVRHLIPYHLRALLVRLAPRTSAGDPQEWRRKRVLKIMGALDTPRENETVWNGVIECAGWALCDGRGPSRVDICADGAVVAQARLGIARPDLAVFGAAATFAGFEVALALPLDDQAHHAVITALIHFEQDGAELTTPPRTVVVPPQTASVARNAEEGAIALLRRTAHDARPHVLAVTHQLDLGGGQLYLHDLLLGLDRLDRWRFTVATAIDGPLRVDLEARGIEVHVLDPWPVHSALAYQSRLDELGAWARERGVDAVLANTAVSFFGIDLATRLGIPSVWAIHESYPMNLLWFAYFSHHGCHPAVRAAADQALDRADRLVFEAEATRRLYAVGERAARCVLFPYGIDTVAMTERARGLDRRAARALLRVDDDAELLLCVGTYEPRKAQPSLLHAFREVAERHPRAIMALVGDRPSPYSELLHQAVQSSGLGDRVRLAPIDPDLLPWYRAADLLISASDVESMPRSALEAMVCETPVLATNIFGVPELIEDGVDGWLFAQRDLTALMDGMDRALSTPLTERAAMGARAAERVRRDHDASGYVDAYAQLFDELLTRQNLDRVAIEAGLER